MNNISNSASFLFNSITQESVKFLENLEFSQTNTRRLCLHRDIRAEMHMMLIDIKENTCFPYHKHNHSEELVILIKGSLTYEFENSPSIILSRSDQLSLIIPRAKLHQVTSGKIGARYIEIIKGANK